MPGGGPIHSPRSCEEGDVKDALVRSMFAAISVAGRGERARFLERLGLVSASPAAEPARSPRDGERNRTRHSFSAFPRPDGFGARAVVCLPASFWLVPCPASSPRGPSSRRLAALLSAVEGHRPSLALPEALDLGRRGRDRGARPGGRGKGLTTAKGRFEFLASARGRAQTAELSDAPSSRDRPRGSRIDDRRGGRYLAAPEFHHGVTSPCVSRLDYPARFGLDRSGLGEPRLLTSQAVQIAPSTSNITLPPR